jgi:hypothetical protein
VILRNVFEAPFMLRSETLRREDGSWIRVVSYPELDCAVEGVNYLAMLDELEVARVRNLAFRIEFGSWNVPVRNAVPAPGLNELLSQAGRSEWVDHLDEDVDDVAAKVKG